MTQPANRQFERLFKAAPAKILVLKPLNYEIIAVTGAYLKATATLEGDLLGKPLFGLAPGEMGERDGEGLDALKRSLERVQSLKTSDAIGMTLYPVRFPGGLCEERFFSIVNSPVLTDAGDVEFIQHRVEDAAAAQEAQDAGADPVIVQDLVQRPQDLEKALSKLREQEARMRSAERLLTLGAWEFNVETGTLSWSRQVYEIYGVPPAQPAPDLDGYFALLHPEDRGASRAVYDAFAEERAPHIAFEHRVIAADGSVKHVKGVGERHQSPDGEIVVGYVQDITAFVGARQKLDQAEHLISIAGEKARLGGWRVDLGTGSIVWTPTTAAIHGRPAGYSPRDVPEAIGYYAPEFQERIQGAIERCARHGEAFDAVCQLQTAEGRRPWIRVIGVPERGEDGGIHAVQGAFQDITALHEAQARADEAERQRLNVLENISDAFLALDDDWNFTYLNRQAGALVERAPEDLVGKNIWEEFPEAVHSEFHRQYQAALDHQKTVRFQAFYPPLDKWFYLTAYPISGGLAVYFRDITGERDREQRLRLVETALSRLNDVVMITEADALDAPDGPRIVYVNDAFEQLTGYTKDEAIGQTPRILQGPETEREALDRIRDALVNKESVRCDLLNYTTSGAPYRLELDITPLFDAEGRCTHFVAVERDITARVETERQLREAQKLEAVGHLTGGVAHDFNNLLTVIIGNAEMLTDLADDPDLRSMAEIILQASESGAELTKRLLAFARRQPLNPKPTNINQVIEAADALIRRTVPEHIDIVFVPDPDLGIAEIDAGELQTAALNLVINARDAMPQGGRLTMETANAVLDSDYAAYHTEVTPGDYVMFSVSDTGTGMDPETVQRAFEPFFTTKGVGEGSGLGLSMVFGFTKQSGGHIKIYSEPGEGTSVKLYFPRVDTGPEMRRRPARTPAQKGGTEHILVVEDNRLVLNNLSRQLRSLGYRVTAAMSGPEALVALQAHDDVDLLLTDIVLPGGMNGRELADRVRGDRPALKVLYTSGYTENAIVHHGRLDPGVDLLSKPYTRSDLAAKVRAVLDKI